MASKKRQKLTLSLPKGCKCIYCYWYKYKRNQAVRCYGFTKEGVKICMESDFMYFSGRRPKLTT